MRCSHMQPLRKVHKGNAMTAKEPVQSDLHKVDRHEITPEEYDEAPELTEEMLARAEIKEGEKVLRAARRPSKS